MEQNLTELRAIGDNIVAAYGATKDGIGMDDMDEGINVMTSIAKAADDIKVDVPSALMETGSQLMRAAAKMRREEKGIVGVE